MVAISLPAILAWSAWIVACVLLTKLVLVIINFTKYARMASAVPGPPLKYMLGLAWELWVPQEDIFQSFLKLVNGFSKESVTRYWFGPFEARFMVHTAKGAEAILNNTRYLTKADDYSFFHSWLGLGLLTSDGNRWSERRKMLTPSFHFQILDDFVIVFNEQSDILISLLNKNAGKGSFNIFPYLKHCALDIICESVMGTHQKAQTDSDSEYVKAVNGMGKVLMLRVIRPWLGNHLLFNLFPQKRQETFCLNILHSYSRKLIKERRELRQQATTNKKAGEDIFGKKRRLAFLDNLLDAQMATKTFTDEQIRMEVDTFMFEGHDTTSVALTWTLFLLGHHQEIQRRVQEDIDNVLGDSEGPITAAHISKMKYLEAVIKESLRLYPSVPLFARKLKENLTIDGHTIPAHSNVFVGAYFIHRDPEVFPDPERFNPARFLEEDTSKRSPFAYVPFSAGPRNCIGQKFAQIEEKVVLSHILRNFNITSHDSRESIKCIVEPIIRPAHGLNVSLEKRTKTVYRRL